MKNWFLISGWDDNLSHPCSDGDVHGNICQVKCGETSCQIISHLHLWSPAPLSGCWYIDIFTLHQCYRSSGYIFMNVYLDSFQNRSLCLSLFLCFSIALYGRVSNYPRGSNVCTKFDNILIWWKVSKMYLFHDCELLVSFETINKIELILVPVLSEGDQRPLITQLHRHTDKIFKYFCDTAAKIFLSCVCWYIVVHVGSRGVSQNTKVTTHVETINSQMSQNILIASLWSQVSM